MTIRSADQHSPVRLICLAGLSIFLITASGPNQIAQALPAVSSIALGVTVAQEGDDFATRVLGMPWDMSTDPYPDFPTVFDNVDRTSFSVSNGLWNFTTTNNDPNVWLLFPNLATTQHVLTMGDRFPIVAAKYKLLSFRLCSSANEQVNVYWYDAPLTNPVTPSGISHFINTSAGCRVYAIELPQVNTFQGTWSGNLMGFRLDPGVLNSSLTVQLDWVRLTTVNTATNVVPITWADVPSGNTLYFYLNDTCSATNAMLIGTTPRNGQAAGTFNWGSALASNPTASWPAFERYPLPESFEPGNYRVLMQVDGAGSPICAPLPLTIHQAPRLSFQKPSFYSGPDYATEIIGNPWGMNEIQDIGYTFDMASANVSTGIYNATTGATGDSQLHLNFTAPLDASKYKYLTFRWYMEGAQDIALGWVHRVLWWYAGPGVDNVTTEDMVLYEGWHTYSFDLSQAIIDPTTPSGSWTGFPTVFRLDPHEMPQAATFHVDFVTLTGDEKVTAGAPFRIAYQTTPSAGPTVTFYRDTDRNSSNGGRVALTQYTPPAISPVGPNALYLPTMLRNYSPELNLLTGNSWMWDTTGVPAGTYYISADVNDGVMTTTWYSELPVIVQ